MNAVVDGDGEIFALLQFDVDAGIAYQGQDASHLFDMSIRALPKLSHFNSGRLKRTTILPLTKRRTLHPEM